MNSARAKPAFGTTLNRGNRLSKGLRGAWLFNDKSGSLYKESVNNSAVAAVGGTPTWGTSIFGSAVDFGSGSNYFTVSLTPNDMPALSSNAWTIAALVYPTASVDNMVVLNYGEVGDSNWNYFFGMNSSGNLGCHGSGGTGFGGTSTLAPSVNTWHAIAMSQVSATSRTFFLDGVTQADTTNVGSNSVNATKKCAIGVQYVNGNPALTYSWLGKIAGIFSWNRALSNIELRQWAGDPFQMFRLRSLPVPIHAAAGGGGAATQQQLMLLGLGA